ncbi:MAG: ABC transporter permease subunit, partial [Planctomycetota bacterium]|nr:ABC transporter permease subunit [Planctomycetota bacterium]
LCLCILAVMVIFTVKDRNGILAISIQTWKEAIRSKGFLLVLVFTGALLFGLTFVEVAGSQKFGEEWKIRNTLEWSLRLMALFTAITAIFLTSLSLPNDITDRRIYTLISKPVSRWSVICGKVLGFSVFTFTMLLSMAVFMVIFVRWTARDASDEVKERLLGSRELIKAEKSSLHTYRKATVTIERGLFLRLRPHSPPGSMFRFVMRTDRLAVVKKDSHGRIPAVISLGKLTNKEGKATDIDEDVKDSHLVVQIVDPTLIEPGKPIPANAGTEMKVPLDPERAVSPLIYLDRKHFFTTPDGFTSLGIKVVRVHPPTRSKKLDFLRSAENRRWLFTGINKNNIEIDSQDLKDGPGKAITVQCNLRLLNRSNYYTGSKRIDLGFWYYTNGERHLTSVRTRDGRKHTFLIPSDAIDESGNLVIDLECPERSPHYYGYDGEEYTVSLLSRPRSFEFNVLKAVAMLSCQVIVIVVVAVSASTFLSWPITALTAIFVYFCGSMAAMFGEIIDAIGTQGHHGAPTGSGELTVIHHIMKFVLEILQVVTPNLDRLSPMEMLSHGYSVTFGTLFSSFLYMNLFVTLSLSAGWIIFRHRSIH